MIRITIDQLKTFLSVVRLGGVRKAAHGLNLTQPAVTARIRGLEEVVGAPLFERTGAGMRLTKRGETLRVYAEQIEHLTHMIARTVVAPASIAARLRLGVSETVAQCWLPDLVSRLHGAFPGVEIEINVDVSTNLRAALLDRHVDLAILLGPVSEYSVDNVALPGFALRWYASAATPAEADPAALLRGPVLSYPRNTRPYRDLKALLLERVGPGATIFPSSSLSACFRLVQAQLGVAALPKALGDAYVRAGAVREFDPGWAPEPLRFSASFLGEPRSFLTETAAALALEAALAFEGDKNVL